MIQTQKTNDRVSQDEPTSQQVESPKELTALSLKWTPAKVAAFWDFLASRPMLHQWYFSNRVGEALLSVAKQWIPVFGETADFGAGPGYLLRHLMKESKRCWALDFSEQSLRVLQEKYSHESRVAGLVLINEETRRTLKIDTVFCLETVEHLFPDHVDWTLGFLRDILRPGGKVVVSVPNEEQLEKEDIFCAECNTVFHRWQHMSRWTAPKMRETMEKNGFSTIYCDGLNLASIQAQMEYRRQMADDWWGGKLWRSFLDIIDTRSHVEGAWGLTRRVLFGKSSVRPIQGPNPNLVYVGKRV